jgi:hypothetical protein
MQNMMYYNPCKKSHKPNKETVKALNDSKFKRNLKKYENVEALFQEVQAKMIAEKYQLQGAD